MYIHLHTHTHSHIHICVLRILRLYERSRAVLICRGQPVSYNLTLPEIYLRTTLGTATAADATAAAAPLLPGLIPARTTHLIKLRLILGISRILALNLERKKKRECICGTFEKKSIERGMIPGVASVACR